MNKIKFIFLVASLLIVGLLSSCQERHPDCVGPSDVKFRIINLSPDVIPTKDLHVQVQNDKGDQYFQLSQHNHENSILLSVGSKMYATPRPIKSYAYNRQGWYPGKKTFDSNILVFRNDKIVGTIKAQMEITEISQHRVNRLISYTGFKSVELVLGSNNKKDPSDQGSYLDTFKVKF